MNNEENPNFPTEHDMEEALKDFYIQDKYYPVDIIKYTVMVVYMDHRIKQRLCFHSDYNKLFFEDLKDNRYLGDLFKIFPESSWLVSKFRTVKYQIKEFLTDCHYAEKYQILMDFLNDEEFKEEVHFKNFAYKLNEYVILNCPSVEQITIHDESYSESQYATPVKFTIHYPHSDLPSTNIQTKFKEEFINANEPMEEIKEDELLFVSCDVEENKRNKIENIYTPNKFFYASDLEQARMIQNLIDEIRNNFEVNADDEYILREIICRLSFDIDDIFLYLSNPDLYENLLWTDEEDNILKDQLSLFYNLHKLEEVKGKERIERRNKYLQL